MRHATKEHGDCTNFPLHHSPGKVYDRIPRLVSGDRGYGFWSKWQSPSPTPHELRRSLSHKNRFPTDTSVEERMEIVRHENEMAKRSRREELYSAADLLNELSLKDEPNCEK